MFKSDRALTTDAIEAHIRAFGPAKPKSLKVNIERRYFGLIRVATVTHAA